MKNELTAICDLDETLVKVNSFTEFVKWFAIKRPLLFPRIARIVFLRKRRRITHADAKQMILRLAESTLSPEEIDRWVRRLLHRHINQVVMNAILEKKVEGCYLLLATAAPAIYAHTVARMTHFDAVVATPLGGHECFGQEKLRRVREVMRSHDLSPAIFYTDSRDDQPLADYLHENGAEVVWVAS